MSHTPEFRMSIDVTLSGAAAGDCIDTDKIKAALAEVVSRMDFGTKLLTGRVLDHYSDHNDKRVTVDITYVDARRPRGTA